MTEENNYLEIDSAGGAPIRAWVKGVMFEDQAAQQLRNAAQLPFIFRWIAAMPDVHMGIGATVGSVIPTKGAIIPAAVGVDIGCGMAALRTRLQDKRFAELREGIWLRPDNLDVELTPDVLREIDAAAAKITLQGERYPEHLQKLIGR